MSRVGDTYKRASLMANMHEVTHHLLLDVLPWCKEKNS